MPLTLWHSEQPKAKTLWSFGHSKCNRVKENKDIWVCLQIFSPCFQKEATSVTPWGANSFLSDLTPTEKECNKKIGRTASPLDQLPSISIHAL